MTTPHKRTMVILILMVLVSLACLWEPIRLKLNSATEDPNETPEPTATQSLLEALEEAMQGTHMANTMSAMETMEIEILTPGVTATNEDENLIYGVKPEKIICEGEYTTTVTNLDEPDQTCSFIVPFTLEFWNVGTLGSAEYGEATFYWSYVNFQWGTCIVDQMTETTSTGTFSGGPNGLATAAWASIQLTAGQTGTLSYSDEDESAYGTCIIDNPAAFSGWTGP